MTTRFTSKTKGVWNTVGNQWIKTDTLLRTGEPYIQYGAVVFHTPATKHNHLQHTRAGLSSARLFIFTRC